MSNPPEIGARRLTHRDYPMDHILMAPTEESEKVEEPPSIMDLGTTPLYHEGSEGRGKNLANEGEIVGAI